MDYGLLADFPDGAVQVPYILGEVLDLLDAPVIRDYVVPNLRGPHPHLDHIAHQVTVNHDSHQDLS